MASGPTDSARSFAELGVPSRLVDALVRQGITSPFPIQVATLPDSLSGRDVLGRGRTGSGKTLAFALPVLARLAETGRRPRGKRPNALVLLPTRELASQVHATFAPLAAASGLTTTTVFGGVSYRPQVAALARGVDVVIATPGRLEDLMREGHLSLEDIAITVLDEADHMADLGFLPGVRRILNATPADGQRLLFSATLDNGVDVIVRRYLTNPVTHSVDDDPSTLPDIDHHVLTVTATDKPAVIRELAGGLGRALLFTRTKHSARKLARDLTESGVPALDLHGNLSQQARDRNLGQFRDGAVRVLVATDVAARGIHVDDVSLVVHVDPPTEHKAYLHRSGRTARAGASGVVVTVQTRSQREQVNSMTRRAGIRPTVRDVSVGSSEVLELTGPRAEYVRPKPVQPEGTAPRSGRSSKPGAAPKAPGGRRAGRPSEKARSTSRSERSGRHAAGTSRPMSAAEFSSSRRGR